jgi:hypothetical protein
LKNQERSSTGEKMKRNGLALLALAVCVWLSNAPLIRAQTAEDKPKAEIYGDKVTPLKIQVVLTEFDGEKKVKSMPYVSYLNVYEGGRGGNAKVRIGTRIPVPSGKDTGMQYIDVGTNIDCRATHGDAGSFHLEVVVERSWVESEVVIPAGKESGSDRPELPGQFKEPIIRQFKSEIGVSLRDGQTSEATLATDPISGRVSKIEVSLSVVK